MNTKARVSHACSKEGKGREGKGTEREGNEQQPPPTPSTPAWEEQRPNERQEQKLANEKHALLSDDEMTRLLAEKRAEIRNSRIAPKELASA
jgi:hypothetical protein